MRKGPPRYWLQMGCYDAFKYFQRCLPEPYQKMRWGMMKILRAFEVGYAVDAENGTVLGKRGKPLKPFIYWKTGEVLVDVRLKLPIPFDKTKIYAKNLIGWQKYGPDLFARNKMLAFADGNPQNLRADNLLLVPRPKKAKVPQPSN